MSVDPVSADHVLLDLAATSREGAVRMVAELLRSDGHIASWDQFWASVGPRQIVDLRGGSCGVCLAHGRDNSVAALRLAAARLAVPIDVPGTPALRLVFVFAIPSAMADDYLRSVGALARCCGQDGKLQALLDAPGKEEFAAALRVLVG
ncbi:MAG: PTS sugar transporter subunit IIA [Chthoniobacterales bacterium]|jgi:mannitol/fructose-specific phosphotransferase system IIA component (Ntr-type)